MDLRSVLNTSDNGERARAKAPPTPQRQQQQQQQQQQQPISRPTQSPAQYGYRDYPHQQPQPQPSPSKPPGQDYQHPSQHHQPKNYPPHSPYQGSGPYPGRPAPPPLQPPNSYHDVRSPGGSRSNPPSAVSPYRPTPTPNSAPGGNAGYPFPPTQSTPEIASPIQRHQYPPAQYQHQRQDSYPQAQGVAAHGASPYVQQQHTVPQTPPVGTPGGSSHAYLHQRSHSTQSTPTPTSAQSQHQYGPPYPQASPVLATQPPPADYNRHPSQPAPPRGPPPPQQAPPKKSVAAGNFTHPPSPYQQRISSAGSLHAAQAHQAPTNPPPPSQPQPQPHPHPHPHPQSQSQPHPQSQPQSKPQHQPVRHRTNSSAHESPVSDAHRRSRSYHEREQSLSVSPKTRVGSIPSTSDRASFSVDADSKTALGAQRMVIDSERAVTPAKRKLEDRSMSPREMEHKERKPPPGEINGGHTERTPKSASPVVARKKRVARSQPPLWAQSARILGKNLPKQANFVLQKRIHSHIHAAAPNAVTNVPIVTNDSNAAPTTSTTSNVNGKQDSISKPDRTSRHASPETTRSQHASQSQPPPSDTGTQDGLGPWEASITGVKPFEELSKTVADFLFIHVVNSSDMQEISSRGIQFEIEAKLGTLIDKDTNHRVDRFLDSECVLHDNGRVAFRSSMTEVHHKSFNDFLNNVVIQTDPRAPQGGNRVQVHYKHRREVDRFFELPQELHGHLPGCMRARLGSRSRSIRVRVTYDQKTKAVLNKIIKARVADIDIHMPNSPMDCRISINLEMNWDGAVEELEQSMANQGERQPDRNKDRLSYTQGHYQIDLTQVTQGAGGPVNPNKEHELEIELAAGALIEQGRRAMSGAPHRYQELVEGFVDNVRVLARKTKEFTRG